MDNIFGFNTKIIDGKGEGDGEYPVVGSMTALQ